jgi:hypothetical protein
MMKEHDEEVMELSHDAVPGYRPVFYVVFAVTVIYLVYVMLYGGDIGGIDAHGIVPTGTSAH